MKKIVIVCAGDFGRELVWLIEDINAKDPTYEILGLLDDDENKNGEDINGYKCIGKIGLLSELAKEQDICAVIATQSSQYRKKFVEENPDFHYWETLIHPSANISSRAMIGKGCIICANCCISVDSVIGNHCIFNIGTTIGHDCVIQDYVSLMSGTVISGHVSISEGAYCGSNSTVIPGRRIGKYSTVGAGSVVIRNVKDNITVMGVPAKTVAF